MPVVQNKMLAWSSSCLGSCSCKWSALRPLPCGDRPGLNSLSTAKLVVRPPCSLLMEV